MNKTIFAAAMAAALVAPMFAHAEAGDWVVRLRAVNVMPNESSSLGKDVNNIYGAALMTPSADLSVDNNLIPELDISYYFTKNVAAELILALGTKHDVSIVGDNAGIVGNQNLGEVDLLPPTLTLQWHFNPDQMIDPYVGAGINYTIALDRHLKGSAGAINGSKIKIDRDSWGWALQAGVDVNLDDGWLVNFDVKYIDVDTNVKLDLANNGDWRKIDDLDINPWVIGVGIGKKF
ncbi:MAG TPA: OmpW family outer membrane protein [Methylophilaceae bacterium]|nr:OmpW family outer membrane protein [Methylophilaceae bacterium]